MVAQMERRFIKERQREGTADRATPQQKGCGEAQPDDDAVPKSGGDRRFEIPRAASINASTRSAVGFSRAYVTAVS